jgi:hypothetical protein
MHPQKWLMVVINIVGGIAVLGSYALGILTHPNAGQILWAGVPQSIRPFYTAGMLLAALGYFAFTYFILFRLDPQATRVTHRFGFGLFNTLYALILFPSALWMPLTFLAVERSGLAIYWLVRLVLAVVGIASVGLFVALLKVTPPRPLWAQRLALVGSAAFLIQTAILDAIVWGAFFRL